jgi:DNA-binding CsgD family transcriptional regulator/tetratricopeptide (TPR) repeat protein
VELLEREAMLRALAEYAETARLGDGRLVLVSGESGIGKTALVEAFQSQLAGARWLWGGCDDLVTPRPLGPLFDIAPQASPDFEGLCESGAPRDKLFAAFASEINSGETLTVVVIEDVHWADEATIDLLSFLGRRLSRIRALVLVTFRDDEIGDDHRLRVVLGDLATQRSTRRMGLPPLSAGAVQTLIGQRDFDPAELRRVTGGNPFFVTELVEAGWPSVPPTIRDAVGARLARSSPRARQVLEAAAVIGTRADRSLLDQVLDDVDGLGECLESRILVVDGASLRFRHELVRMAVAAGIAPQRKTDLHARLLAILAERPKIAPAVLAHHAEGAGDAKTVVRYARAAAIASSALGAHREGAALFERALQFAVDAVDGVGADQVTLADLHEGLAVEYSLLDRWDETETELRAALALRQEQGDALRVGEDLRLLSTALWRLCRGDESARAGEDAVRALDSVPESAERTRAQVNLGACTLTRGRIAEGLELLEQARASAERLGRFDLLSYALNAIGLGRIVGGRDGVSTIEDALRIALDADLQELAGRAYSSLVEAAVTEQLFDLADRHYALGMAYCDERELGVFGLCMDGWQALALLRTCRWDEAAQIGHRMLGSRGISPVNQINPLVVLGTIAARRGEQDAWALLDRAADLADGNGEPQWIVLARTARAEARWLEGDLELTAQEIVPTHERAAGSVDPWMSGTLDVWLARLGRPVPAASGNRPEPVALEITGDLEGAATAWQRLGRPYDAALARLGSGDETSLRQGIATFDELGATAASAAVRRRMRQLGMQAIPRGSRPATKAAPGGLTAREQEVLTLVADGLADREISQRLFISERTVHHHVSAILSKIGVSSRTAAAREAVKLGIGTQAS